MQFCEMLHYDESNVKQEIATLSIMPPKVLNLGTNPLNRVQKTAIILEEMLVLDQLHSG